MEAKKNPDQDVHRTSSRFFLVGLGISISIMIVAFEWTTQKISYAPDPVDPTDGSIEVMSNNLVYHTETPQQLITEKKTPTRLINLTTTTESTASTTPVIDESDLPSITTEGINVEIEPEYDSTEIVVFPEAAPMPLGGYEQFYAQLSKNMKYPKQAIRQGVDGKVFVEFVVGRQGQINNLKVVKGIGSGCDEEAMRVLALTRWEAGRQRGRPVNVRMIIPVFFKIQ
jgi:periplasmic protein TonB